MLKDRRGTTSVFLAIFLVIMVSIITVVLCDSLATFLLLTRKQEAAFRDLQYAEFGLHRARWLLDIGHTDAPYADGAFPIDVDGDATPEATASITIAAHTATPDYNYTIESKANNRAITARYSGGFLTWWD